MSLYDDRSSGQPPGPKPGFSLGDIEPGERVRDEQIVMTPSAPIRSGRLPDDLYVQLQDNDGRLLFDVDGRPVMVRHMLQKPRTVVAGVYTILTVIVLVILVNLILAVVGLIEIHNLSNGSY